MFRLSRPDSGKIKIRIFALLLLIVGCSIVISAYRSLSREFSGIVLKKSTSPGFASIQYWLFLAPADLVDSKASGELINKITDYTTETESGSLPRVGVSSVVYEEADILSFVDKKAFSPVIELKGQPHIDLGMNWLIIGIAAIILSLWMYRQTLKKGPEQSKDEPEEIEVPGIS